MCDSAPPDAIANFQRNVTLEAVTDSGLVGSTDFHTRGTSLGGVPREQKMLNGHLPRVIYDQVY